MQELEKIITSYRDLPSQKACALATVVKVEGSSYRRVGSRMFVTEDGTWVGGISGGCLEGDALRKAKRAILKDESSFVTYDTTDDDAYQIGVGLGCQGIIHILISPLDRGSKQNPIRVLESVLGTRTPQILFTLLKAKGGAPDFRIGDLYSSHDLLNLAPSAMRATLEREIQHVQKSGRSEIVHLSTKSVELEGLLEYFPPAIKLLIFGHQYDIYSLIKLSSVLGWKNCIIGKPDHIQVVEDLDMQIVHENDKGSLVPDEHTAAITMGHDLQRDTENLKFLLSTNVPYIGMLGPKKRSDDIVVALQKSGVRISAEDQSRIYNPVGLDIGATNPSEIALSILSEIRAFFSKREGGHLRLRLGPINDR